MRSPALAVREEQDPTAPTDRAGGARSEGVSRSLGRTIHTAGSGLEDGNLRDPWCALLPEVGRSGEGRCDAVGLRNHGRRTEFVRQLCAAGCGNTVSMTLAEYCAKKKRHGPDWEPSCGSRCGARARRLREAALRGLTSGVLVIVLWVGSVFAWERTMVFTWPEHGRGATCLSPADTTHREDPDHAEIYAFRVPQYDTLNLGTVSGLGKAGLPDSFRISVADTVHYIVAYLKTVDRAGNISCMSNQFLLADSTLPPVPGIETAGLLGEYHSNATLSSLFGTRVDSVVNFNWSTGVAYPGLPSEWFSVRWRGKIRAHTTGTYTFRILVNDACRLWIGGTKVIDDWATGDGEHVISGSYPMTQGSKYEISVEMFEKTGSARATLYWIPPGGAEHVVPQSCLSHETPEELGI